MANELEKLKEGYNNLNLNYSEAAGQLESFSDIEQKYNCLLQEHNRLKKENNDNKNTALQNAKIINSMKPKMTKNENNIKCLINEKENLKQEMQKLRIVEKKYNELCDENENLRQTSEQYDNLKREYDLLMTKLQKKNIIEKENENLKEKIRILNAELKDIKNKYESLIPLYEEQKRKFDELTIRRTKKEIR